MQARFRIRTADGQELEPRTLEIFSEMVRSGVIRPQDQVFDALTEQWVEAVRHPMVRLFQDPLVAELPLRGGGFYLALAEPSGPSAEERDAAFIRRMEEERRADPERVPLALELPVVTGRHDPPCAAADWARTGWEGELEASVREPAGTELLRRRETGSVSRWRGAALAGAVTALLAGAAGLLSLRAPHSPRAVPNAAAATVAPRGVVAERGTRDEASAGFLRRVAGIRSAAGSAEVPDMWLEGRYLADAAAYAEVRGYWEGVRDFVNAARRGEEELYREAWLEAAAELGMSGPVRSLRLAAALGEFASGRPVREAHYRRVEELAAAALSLHDLLVELGGRVTYEPMRGGKLSADPVLEAAGADPAAQALLEEALDRVLAALRGPEGDPIRDRARLAAWMVQVPL